VAERGLDNHLARVVFHFLATDKPDGAVDAVLAEAVVNDSADLGVGLLSAGISHEQFTLELVQRALSLGGKAASAVRCSS
jgi:hypothetical protein